jgi:aminoglycoside phosphotransferase (APT) family kinase protein
VEHRPIERPRDAFQQPVAPGVIEAACRRAFGAGTAVVSAVELAGGTYNTTYRVDLGGPEPVVLRIAPEPARQYRSEREFLRNEHLSLPYLAPLAALMPRTLAADFTHDLVGRDYVFLSHLGGVPAAEGLAAYPRQEWGPFFRGIGVLARTVHAVRGPAFGPVNGPAHATWSAALAHGFDAVAEDLADAGLDAADVRAVARLVRRERGLLDAVTEPRLLHGDLWTGNLMIDPDAPQPVITGVLDGDRTWWGDPLADWPVFVACSHRPSERDAFLAGYGPLDPAPDARRRALVYRARHTAAIRLEAHRGGHPDRVRRTYDDLREVLDALTGAPGPQDAPR